MPDHRVHVVVQQTRVQQFADDEGQPARRGKMVHVRLAVGVNADKQRDDGGDVVEVVPVEYDARRARHGHQMHGVVGRAARGHQADDCVDKRFFGQHFAYGLDAAVFDAV